LASVLARRGASIDFICRDHGDDATRLLKDSGFRVHLMPPGRATAVAAESPYAHWAGVSSSDDAKQTAEVLAGRRPDWLVVDHYAFSAAWEEDLRTHAGKILAIDDLARTHVADVVFDQNFAADPDARYQGRVRPDSRLLLGPRYALLDDSYAAARAPRDRTAAVRRICMFFGGVDAEDLTGRALRALDDPGFKGFTLDVLLGPSSIYASAVAAYVPAHVAVNVHRALPSLAGVLSEADIALGAGGGNTWERCCLGLPSIVVSAADNQIPASRALGEAGITLYLGRSDDVDESVLRRAAHALMNDPARRQDMSERSRLLVDGRGAQRVAEVMAPTPVDQLTLRAAALEDREFFFHVVNDPLVRTQSFSKETILWDRHKVWFDEKMRAGRTRMYVLEAQGLPAGVIRFDLNDGFATLNYALDAVGRGKKWGIVLVEFGLKALAAGWTGEIRAAVKTSNRPSCLIFEKLAFRAATDAAAADQVIYALDASELRARYGP
jgi:UDP-2,4-diacetamido-2,4,6-trideoxy-beta-L-altropyranose hydrolase